MATDPHTTPPAVDVLVHPGPHSAIETTLALDADSAIDLALRIVAAVQAAKRAAP